MADSDILRGAEQRAAGETLGLTQDQVLALKRQQAREAQRENRARRAERAGNEGAAREFLADDSRRFQSTGSFEEQERYADPFGIPVSAADPEQYTSEELREINRDAFQRERGEYVIVDRGRGKERLWRERGQLVSEPKYAKNKKVDMADPFVKPPSAPRGTGLGGSTGLTTQLADMILRGEISRDDLVPGSQTRTIGNLLDEMDREVLPVLYRDADRAQAAQARAGLSNEEIAQRAQLEARIAASPQGNNIRGLTSQNFGNVGQSLSPQEVNAIRQDSILRSFLGTAEPGGPSRGFDSDVEIAATPIIQERIARANVNDPAARAISDTAAAREAGRYQVDYEARSNLAAINRVDSLGLASKKFNRGVPMDQFNVVQAVDPNTFTDAVQMIGPDGQTVGYTDDTDKWVADVNLASPESTSNAPTSRTATWMEGNLPNMGAAGGTSFGARQVNPGDELSLLSQRLGNFAPATGIRGIDDLEQAVRAVTVDAAFSGRTMWNRNPETGAKIAVQDPGIDEVLAGLDYTPDEKARLASALQSVEAAQRSPVNRLQKEMYAAGLTPQGNSNVATGYEKDVQLERITNERVGRDNKKTGEKRTSVRKGLRELDASPARVFQGRDPSTIYTTAEDGSRVMLPEAQQDLTDAIAAQGDSNKPFQAAPQGSKPERAQFLSKRAVNMTPSERIKAYGPEGGAIANRLEVVRQEIDSRRGQKVETTDPIAAEFRKRDAQFEAQGQARDAADNAREVNEAFERMGMSLEGKGQMLLGGQIVPDSRTRNVPERNVVPQGPIPQGRLKDVLGQPVPAPVQSQKATSAVSNPATDPTPLTDRGGWMGGGGSGRIVNPWKAEDAEPERTPLSGATPDGPSSSPRRIRQEADYRQAVRNNSRVRKIGRNAAIAGGASAGLSAIGSLIGGERDRREQEAV